MANLLTGTAVPPSAAAGRVANAPGAKLAAANEMLSAKHQEAQNQFDAVSSASTRMNRLRSELDSLRELGDTVTPDDVMDSAGRLVASGADPLSLAGLLADMPEQGGEALAGWVAQHDEAAQQKAGQIDQAQQVAKHQLGVSAIHAMAGQVVGAAAAGGAAGAAPTAAAPAPAANPLMN